MSQPEPKNNSFLTPKKLLLATFAVVSTAVAALVVGVAVTFNPTKETVATPPPPKAHTVEILSPVGAPASAVMVAASSIETAPAPKPAEETAEATTPAVATAAATAVAAATVAAKAKKTEEREPPARKSTPNSDLAQNKADKAKDKLKQDKTDLAKAKTAKTEKNTDLAKNKQDKAKTLASDKPKADRNKTASNSLKETTLEPINRRSNATTVAAKSSDTPRAAAKPRPRPAETPSEPKPARQTAQQKDVMDNLF